MDLSDTEGSAAQIPPTGAHGGSQGRQSRQRASSNEIVPLTSSTGNTLIGANGQILPISAQALARMRNEEAEQASLMQAEEEHTPLDANSQQPGGNASAASPNMIELDSEDSDVSAPEDDNVVTRVPSFVVSSGGSIQFDSNGLPMVTRTPVGPQSAKILVLTCAGPGCDSIFCHRGLWRPRQTEDCTTDNYYTSDTGPQSQTVATYSLPEQSSACSCRKVGLACKICGNNLGAFVVVSCSDNAVSSPGYAAKKYPFRYHPSALKASVRVMPHSNNSSAIWRNIPSKAADAAQGLHGDLQMPESDAAWLVPLLRETDYDVRFGDGESGGDSSLAHSSQPER